MQAQQPDTTERRRSFAVNLALVPAGYCVAVITASFVSHTAMLAREWMRMGLAAEGALGQILSGYLLAAAIVFITAWPGFLVTIALLAWSRVTWPPFFAIMGAVTAVSAVPVLVGLTGAYSLFRELLPETPSIFLGGLAGGFAYGVFARRYGLFSR